MKNNSSESKNKRMQAIKNKDSKIELVLRQALWKRGLRYRKNSQSVFGHPDIVFVSKKIAVFCDSEFWHGYDWKRQKKRFKSNRKFWITKIERNIARDKEVNDFLKSNGWVVIRFWGEEILKNPERCADVVEKEVKKVNNADYGMSLQKLICDKYGIDISHWALAQFTANYNSSYENELKPIIPVIFEKIKSEPVQLMTYTQELTQGQQNLSPHNFLLADGRTCSIRTMKTSDKVSPRIIGQAGFPVLNEFFSDVYGKQIKNQEDVRRLVYEHIHEILPVFIDYFFQSDVTVFISRQNLEDIQVISIDEVANYSFSREEFSFTRNLDAWKESTTLKYHGKTIAEIQTHKERSFKFRFKVSAIPEWFKVINENNESLGMSAEGAICEYFHLKQPASFNRRVIPAYVRKLMPVVADAFKTLPKAISHTGSTSGDRGEQSKCSYDFILEGNKTLSLKTNKGKKVCPPEVGQPGSKTCLLYFSEFFEPGTKEITNEDFKMMVLNNIEKIMPIYVDHLFDSDWLLWIYEEKDCFKHKEISKDDIMDFEWERKRLSFTKPTIAEWNESNTIKYDGVTIGEFQVHTNRNCFKYRFHMQNLLNTILKSGKKGR